MKKFLLIFIILFSILFVSSCRKSSRTTHNSNRKEYFEKKERRNIPNKRERDHSDRTSKDDETIDNDDVNVTSKSVEERRSYWSLMGKII